MVKNFIKWVRALSSILTQRVHYRKKLIKYLGDKSDLEEFLALEQIKAQEDELRELMIYTGRTGICSKTG